MTLIDPLVTGNSGVSISHRIWKYQISFLCMLLPLAHSGLRAQIPTEQELFSNGQIPSILAEQYLQTYGPDQNLIRGIGYINEHRQSKGHKFLGEDEYQEGSLEIGNRVYGNLLLKYDLYNQQILLLYRRHGGSTVEIIVGGHMLEGFRLGNRVFRIYDFPEADPAFFQEFKGEKIDFLYHWKINLIPVVSSDYMSEFSEIKRTSYMQIDSVYYEFRNKKTFLEHFPDHRADIKKFLKRRQILIRHASEPQIRELHNFCNSIMAPNPFSQ